MSVRKRKWMTGKGVEREAWCVDYVDQQGKRRHKTFARKRDADVFASTSHVEVREGRHTPASESLTVGELADLWLEDCEAERLEHSTIKQRQGHVRLHIGPFIGPIKLSDLTATRVDRFVDQMRDGGMSLAMRRKVLTNLKTILSFGQRKGHVAQNVALSVRIRSKDRDESGELNPGVEMPTKKELLTMMDGAPDRWRPFMVTAIFTGARASELRGLRWQDVDLKEKEGVISIQQRADAWGNIGRPKSRAGVRDIPLAPMVINALKEWRLACPSSELDLVFPNRSGGVMNHSNFLKRVYYPLQVENGIVDDQGKPRYSFHALRHAAVSLFIEQNWTAKRVQTIIGHASIAMTYDRYGKLFKDTEGNREAMEKVEATLLAG